MRPLIVTSPESPLRSGACPEPASPTEGTLPANPPSFGLTPDRDTNIPIRRSRLGVLAAVLAAAIVVCGGCGGKIARESLGSTGDDVPGAAADDPQVPFDPSPTASGEGPVAPRRFADGLATCSSLEPPREGIPVSPSSSHGSPRGGVIRPGYYVLVRAEAFEPSDERVRLALYFGPELTFHTAYRRDRPNAPVVTFWGQVVVEGDLVSQRGPGCWPKDEVQSLEELGSFSFTHFTAEEDTLFLFGGSRTYTFVRSR